MSERPNFAEVLAGHRSVFQSDGDYGEMQWVECSCDDEYWVDTEAGYDEHEAHLAAVLNAEVDRWLADGGTRERVARAINSVDNEALVSTNFEYIAATYDEQATAALAALATPNVPTAEEGER